MGFQPSGYLIDPAIKNGFLKPDFKKQLQSLLAFNAPRVRSTLTFEIPYLKNPIGKYTEDTIAQSR